MTERDQFLHSLAKQLARARNPEIAVKKFVEFLKAEKNELKVFEKGANSMNELKIFENPDFGKVRVVEEEGQPLFCGADVARALGYAKPQNAIAVHCKGALKRGTPTPGGFQELLFIPEGDVYRLITHSQLPAAEDFERWVFDDVLPTIRKTGSYSLDDESRKLRARAMALNAANRSARMLMEAYDSAGIQPSYKVLALTDLYRNEGLKLPTPPLEVDEATYDFTEMAEALGILSEASGKPHAQAVGAIVSTLAIPEQMIVHAPYDRNGHAADYDRYKAPVLDMVRNWLVEHGNPRPIAAKGKNYRVKYAS